MLWSKLAKYWMLVPPKVMSAAVVLLIGKGVPKVMLEPFPPYLVPPSHVVVEVRIRNPQSVSTSIVISKILVDVSYRPTAPTLPIQSHLEAEGLDVWTASVL